MSIVLYYSPMSSSSRIMWALEELGVPYEKARVHLDKGEQKAPEYLKLNPNGKVPTLVDGDTKMFESVAILIYLGDKYGVAKGLWPKPGTPEHSEALSWSVWSCSELQPTVVSFLMHASDRSFAFPKDQRHAPTVEASKKSWDRLIGILDGRLEGREYIVGKSFSLCDVAVASIVGFAAMMGGLPLDAHKNVAAWLPRCQQRPAMAKTMSQQS